MAKGYEVRAGEYVLLDQQEIDTAVGERSHRIELEEFRPGRGDRAVYYDRGYYLGAGRAGA